MTTPTLGKDVLTLFRPSRKSAAWRMFTSAWRIPRLEDRHKGMLLQNPGLCKATRAPYLSDAQMSLFTMHSTAYPMLSSSIYLALILFSNSVSINNYHRDGEESSVGSFRFGTNRRKYEARNQNILECLVQATHGRKCPGHTHFPEMHLFVPNKS